jgi:hypothetical protein
MKNPSLTPGDDMPKRTYDFGIGGGFVAFTTYRWASTIVKEWGWQPSQRFGTVIGIGVCLTIVLLSIDYVLWRWRFERAIRSGLWASAAIGPYAGLVAWEELAHPAWSHVIGLVGTVVVFVAFYYLDKKLLEKRH